VESAHSALRRLRHERVVAPVRRDGALARPLTQHLRLGADDLLGGSVHVDPLARPAAPEPGDEDTSGAETLAEDSTDLEGADVRRPVRHADDDAGPPEHELELAEIV